MKIRRIRREARNTMKVKKRHDVGGVPESVCLRTLKGHNADSRVSISIVYQVIPRTLQEQTHS